MTPEEIFHRLAGIISDQLGIAQNEIALNDTAEDLGIDSLDVVEICMDVEEEFHINIPDEVFLKFKTVSDVVLAIYAKDVVYENHKKRFDDDSIPIETKNIIGGEDSSGLFFGSASTVNNLYDQAKFNASQGHGFAAERANDLYDNRPLYGKGSRIVGDNNAKNGADRIAGGLKIQSKYCQTGKTCINQCFDNFGNFRYINRQGRPMLIEVPSDDEIYKAAVAEMKKRIQQGEIPGVSDPSEASRIVRRGNFTYEQAKNIAKSGTVESLTYDMVTGAVTALYTFGITSAINFAVDLWNGQDVDDALADAAWSGVKVGGLTLLTNVASSQLARTGINSALMGSTEAIAHFMGSKASAALVNAFREGRNIYGAAATRSAAKLLRGNAITGAVTVAILSVGDAANLFQGRISFAQMFKNVANTGANVAGGMGGWAAGAAFGSAILPGVGTVLGGLAGAFAGGSAAGSAAKFVLDGLIEDDAKEMLSIINTEFQNLTVDYLINKEEGEAIVETLRDKVITASLLKNMYASNNHHLFAHNTIAPVFDEVASQRRQILLPSEDELGDEVVDILEKGNI